jgi:hypothetical protein
VAAEGLVELEAHPDQGAVEVDLHRRRRLVLGEPEVHVPLPVALALDLEAADLEVPGGDLAAVRHRADLVALGDHDHRVDLAVGPDAHAPGGGGRVPADLVDAGGDVDHPGLVDPGALGLRLAPPEVVAPGPQGASPPLVDLGAVAPELSVVAVLGGDQQLRLEAAVSLVLVGQEPPALARDQDASQQRGELLELPAVDVALVPRLLGGGGRRGRRGWRGGGDETQGEAAQEGEAGGEEAWLHGGNHRWGRLQLP